MKSRILTLRQATDGIERFFFFFFDDHVPLSAAQTSFFLITSAVPFISLLFTLTGLLLPDTPPAVPFRFRFASNIEELVRYVSEEIQTAPSVPLLSINAVTTLWAASRGVYAVRSGLARVYDAPIGPNILLHRLKSLASTIIVLLLLTASSMLFIFGDFLSELFGGFFSRLAGWFSTPIFIGLLTVVFTLMFYAVGRRSRVLKKSVFLHIPGALFAAAGWLVFSLIYALYLKAFPTASAIYGGLAAVCLIMLWLYFCMMIFFFGAELNKFLYLRVFRKRDGEEEPAGEESK